MKNNLITCEKGSNGTQFITPMIYFGENIDPEILYFQEGLIFDRDQEYRGSFLSHKQVNRFKASRKKRR